MAQINKSSEYFNTLLHTGDGTDGRAITGVGFQPDWCWFKARNTAYENQVYDVVRGATKRLVTNDTTAEGTQANGLQSFDSDGFTVGNANGTNVNAVTYVSWNWLADNTSGSSNTDGSITSTVSANTTNGFSIVRYTATGSATNFGHGLGTAPSVVIIKDINGTTGSGWLVGHAAIGMTNYLKLNTTAQSVSSTAVFSQNASSSLVYIGNSAAVSESGKDYIAYCFAEKKGFSKFGSYTGNGSTDGIFIYTGFKPAWFMIKKSSAAGDSWVIIDNTRFPYNYVDKFIYADEADAESGSAERLDILSNGIKLRATHPFINTSGATYIYMAFAENPLVGTNNIPATAR